MRAILCISFLFLASCEASVYIAKQLKVVGPKYKSGDCYLYDFNLREKAEPWASQEKIEFSKVLQVGREHYLVLHVYRDDGRFWGLGKDSQSIAYHDTTTVKVNCPKELES